MSLKLLRMLSMVRKYIKNIGIDKKNHLRFEQVQSRLNEETHLQKKRISFLK